MTKSYTSPEPEKRVADCGTRRRRSRPSADTNSAPSENVISTVRGRLGPHPFVDPYVLREDFGRNFHCGFLSVGDLADPVFLRPLASKIEQSPPNTWEYKRRLLLLVFRPAGCARAEALASYARQANVVTPIRDLPIRRRPIPKLQTRRKSRHQGAVSE